MHLPATSPPMPAGFFPVRRSDGSTVSISSSGNDLEQHDLDALSIVERVGSVLSLLGCLFIIVTFLSSKAFHKPINRLVFYASFGNGITNIGTLMAREYVGTPEAAGCQAQAFLIQMFMPADAFWTLTMAINVWLTFYQKFDAPRLRKMEVYYWTFCYGVPFIPALAFLFIRNGDGVRVYGDAILWCWISQDWAIWRIILFYAPVWLVSLITIFIYVRAGGDIYRKRQRLRKLSSTDLENSGGRTNPLASIKTTEVLVTSEAANRPNSAIGLQDMPQRRSSDGPVAAPGGQGPAYSVTISTDPNRRVDEDNDSNINNNVHRNHSNTDTVGLGRGTVGEHSLHPTASSGPGAAAMARKHNFEANKAGWTYAKCALLFFTAMLITWIPSSANRVYSVLHANNESIAPLEYMSAFVLPLQGFWNALIYTLTSWKACKSFFGDVGSSLGQRKRAREFVEVGSNGPHSRTTRKDWGVMGAVGMTGAGASAGAGSMGMGMGMGMGGGVGGAGGGGAKTYESESMTELAHSRPESRAASGSGSGEASGSGDTRIGH